MLDFVVLTATTQVYLPNGGFRLLGPLSCVSLAGFITRNVPAGSGPEAIQKRVSLPLRGICTAVRASPSKERCTPLPGRWPAVFVQVTTPGSHRATGSSLFLNQP